jgi:Tfp pilus assembly protein PilF
VGAASARFSDSLLDEAEETVHQALALNPNWPGAHHVLGHIYQARRQIDKALAIDLQKRIWICEP